ncbi:MAG: hypothetical protein RL685_3845 [Pseudomonadota bacterium]|jgi:translocation and assembly module TamB
MSAGSPQPVARARRWVRAGQALAWSLVFVLSALLGLWLHGNAPALRRTVTQAIQQSLEGRYRGQLLLGEIERLSASGITLSQLELRDPRGAPVLSLGRVQLSFGLWQLLGATLLSGDRPLELQHVRVEHASVTLVSDPETGKWTLERALESPRPPSTKPKRPPRPIRLPALELGDLELVVQHPSIGRVQATVHHVRASADLAGDDSSVSVQSFGLRLLAGNEVPLDGIGSLQLLPNGYVAGTFHGFADGIEVDAAATLGTPVRNGAELAPGELSVRLEVPRAQAQQLRRRFPRWPIDSDVSARITARGPPLALRVEAQLNALTSRIDAKGEVELSETPSARLDLAAHDIDARLFWPQAPETKLGAQAELRVSEGNVLLTGKTLPATVLDLSIPGSHFKVALGLQPSVAIELGDQRGKLSLAVQQQPAGAHVIDLHATGLDLAALPPLTGRVRGRADVVAQATVAGDQLSGMLRGRVRQLDAGTVRATEASIESTYDGAVGDWENLQLQAQMTARQLALGPLSFQSARVTSRGALTRPSFDATLQTAGYGQGKLQGKLDATGAARFSDLRASWSDRDLQLLAEASYVAPKEHTLRVTRLEVSGGVGKLRGSGSIEGALVDLRLDAEGLDAGRLARSFGAVSAGVGGRITGHAELNTTPSATHGNIDLKLRQLAVRDLALGTVAVRASLQERQLVASIEGSESPLGRLDARVNATLAGNVLQARSWQQATGDGSLSWKELPLWPIGMTLPKSGPVHELGGQLDVSLQVERPESGQLPSAFLQATTRELSFNIVPQGRSEPHTFDQFTLHASASVDGQSGHGTGTLLLTDANGALVTSSGSLELDLAQLLRDPAGASKQLLRAPLDILLRLHPRPLSLLPLSLPGFPGGIAGSMQLSGSLLEPTLDVALQGQDLLAGTGADSEPLDISALLRFVPNTGELTGRAEATRSGRSLVSARLEGSLTNDAGNPYVFAAWRAGALRAAAMLNDVPLELWPAAAREHAQARLYGSVAYERRGAEEHQRAQIEIGGLSVNGQPLGNGRLTLDSSPGGSFAELQLGAGDRRLSARLQGAESEPGEPSPGLEGTLNASNFEVASLSPLVSGILSHLGGALDADARLQLRRSKDRDWYLGIDGQASLHGASAQLDLFGLELRELSAKIRARSTPEYTVLLIDSVTAKSRSRSTNVQGDAELWLQGVRLTNGEARLLLSDVPVTLASAARGTVRARIEGQLERKPDHMSLAVKVPELRLLLPSASTRSLIALEPNQDIHVGEVAAPSPARSADALLWKMAFELGNAVRVERADLSLPLRGTPTLDYRDEIHPSGTIEVRPGGRITLFDRDFNVDHGVVQFDPEAPDNPQVDATASWRAQDGTNVYVDITGRANEASVLTRDDRGLQDVDRFYLLTGSPGANVGSGAGTRANEAGDAALGQTFSLGINQLLRESVGNVAVSVGTTADDRASYSASVRLSDRLSFQGSFRPASETKRDENSSDLMGSLDYQFSRRWSLRTELGTTGGAFDLLWSHRY